MDASYSIDEQSDLYKKFVDCFMRGASLQDIYTDSNHGFAIKPSDDVSAPGVVGRQMAAAKDEFTRIFDHMSDLVDPIDKHFGFNRKDVLDFGCGTGALSIAMAMRGATVTGVDPTPVSLEAAQYRSQYFQVSDSFRTRLVLPSPGLPFEDKSFDMVISNSVMEFIPNDRKLHVLEMIRLLKPSGLLVISTENGLFPFDYYTNSLFPRFMRNTLVSRNLPYGLGYFELCDWIQSSSRKLSDLGKQNIFNSLDKLQNRKSYEGKQRLASLIGIANHLLKSGCRLIGIPSDIFLPYATFIFRVEE